MISLSRGNRVVLLVYGLLAVLILGGVSWGTLATLRLERDQGARDLVDAALGVIDRRLGPVVGNEASRPYSEYNACRVPEYVYSDDPDIRPETLVQASPLYFETLQPWIRLHFQVSPEGIWQSPQLPDACLWFAAFPEPDERLLHERRALLASLQEACVSYDVLADRVAAARARDCQYQCHPAETCRGAGRLAAGASPPTGQSVKECLGRGGSWSQVQSTLLPDESCDPLTVAQRNLGSPPLTDRGEADVGVATSGMTPVWIDCEEHPLHQLAFIRSVEVAQSLYFQGFLVDWDMLEKELLAEVALFLPDADLVPVTDSTSAGRNRPVVLPNVEIEADALAAAAVPWSSTHLLLVMVWAGTLAVLGGIGVGIRGLLSLTERRTQFAYAVTHELRTPLTTLRLYTDMLASGMVKKEDQAGYFQTLSAEAERLTEMVSGVLEYARVENRAVALHLESLSVSDLMESIREHCDARCRSAGKSLVVDVNGLGPADVTTDVQLVRQVITNLVDNACKHSRGAEDPRITVRAAAHQGDRIALEVEDRGPGLSVSDRQTVFKPFRRGCNASQSSSGVGLGLALARSWSHLLDGRLELVNDAEHRAGACFRLTIPRRHK